jgi:acetyl-CoA C-acetyltransferase
VAEAFIYDAVRTPRGRGRLDGALNEVPPVQLAAQVLRTLRDRNGLDSGLIDDVVLGVVEPVHEQGADIARIAALAAGYHERVAGIQVNRFCASGLDAVNLAAAQVMAGAARLAVGGGVESLSRVPMAAAGNVQGCDPEVAFDTYFIPQGISGDLLATKYGYARASVDGYAVQSQARAALAWAEERFARSIVPVTDALGRIVLDRDEHMRPHTTLASLARLPASFAGQGREAGYDDVALLRYPELERIEHVHHAGNSAGIVDGAGGVLIGNREIGAALGLRPRARVRAFAVVGSEPTIMLTAPVPATEKVLANACMSIRDIDLFEVNEAFAAVPLWYIDHFGLDPARVNANGGAIAMGHPLGATGAMLVGTVLDELERRDLSAGLVTLCAGAGMAAATIIERV